MNTPPGLLSLNKPFGMTSREAVNHVVFPLRKRLRTRRIKAGHCGTLDPLATGVLIICTGSATRLVQLIQELPKTYVAKFELGRVTNTDDVTGETISEVEINSVQVSESDIRERLPEFIGKIQQVPPMYSAVKIDGKRAYKLARAGREIEIKARPVTVYDIDLLAFDGRYVELKIECGSGTYIRSIGRDLGERLGCGATMASLVRSAIGPFTTETATPVEQLNVDNIQEQILDPRLGIRHLPTLQISDTDADFVRHGGTIPFDAAAVRPADYAVRIETGERYLLEDASREIVAIAIPAREPNAIRPDIVFKPEPA
jgi:tRNA pseudouridine55 synthase